MEDLDVQHNFRSIETWEQARTSLDAIFQRIFDILKSNPSLHALVDGREGDPVHKAGDFVTDYTTGDIKLKMSDGKNLLEIGLSALGGTLTDDQHGALGYQTSALGQHHATATTTTPGFLSAADKVAINGIAAPPSPSNATPASNPLGGAGAAGSNATYSRSDHVHPATSNTTPSPIGTAAIGTSSQPARADHVHAHGNQAGGTQHDEVVAGGASGFMSGGDKTKLNVYNGQFSGAGTGWTAAECPAGRWIIWINTSSNRGYVVVNVGGTLTSIGPTV